MEGNDGEVPSDVVLVNPWNENETQRVLFDATVEAVECSGEPVPTATQAIGTTLEGCAELFLPGGTNLPPGTATLRVDADATQALMAGGWFFELWTMGRNTPDEAWTEPTKAAVHTWEVPLGARDWDEPDAPSFARLGFRAHVEGSFVRAEPSTLNGPIKVVATAVRDPSWVPAPPVDHWNETLALHEFAQPGAIVAYNYTGDWTQPALANGNVAARQPFSDIVPRGTTGVAFGLAWQPMTECEITPEPKCRLFGNLYSDGTEQHWSLSDPKRHYGANWSIFIWPSPFPVVWDEEDATESLTDLRVDLLWECPGGGGSCGAPLQEVTAQVRFRIEAWSEEVDLEAFKARLGVA